MTTQSDLDRRLAAFPRLPPSRTASTFAAAVREEDLSKPSRQQKSVASRIPGRLSFADVAAAKSHAADPPSTAATAAPPPPAFPNQLTTTSPSSRRCLPETCLDPRNRAVRQLAPPPDPLHRRRETETQTMVVQSNCGTQTSFDLDDFYRRLTLSKGGSSSISASSVNGESCASDQYGLPPLPTAEALAQAVTEEDRVRLLLPVMDTSSPISSPSSSARKSVSPILVEDSASHYSRSSETSSSDDQDDEGSDSDVSVEILVADGIAASPNLLRRRLVESSTPFSAADDSRQELSKLREIATSPTPPEAALDLHASGSFDVYFPGQIDSKNTQTEDDVRPFLSAACDEEAEGSLLFGGRYRSPGSVRMDGESDGEDAQTVQNGYARSNASFSSRISRGNRTTLSAPVSRDQFSYRYSGGRNGLMPTHQYSSAGGSRYSSPAHSQTSARVPSNYHPSSTPTRACSHSTASAQERYPSRRDFSNSSSTPRSMRRPTGNDRAAFFPASHSTHSNSNAVATWQWVDTLSLDCILCLQNIPTEFPTAESIRMWLEHRLDSIAADRSHTSLTRYIKFLHLFHRTDQPMYSLRPVLSMLPLDAAQSGRSALVLLQYSDKASTFQRLLDGNSCYGNILRVRYASEVGLSLQDVKAFIRPQLYGLPFFEVTGLSRSFVDQSPGELMIPLALADRIRGPRAAPKPITHYCMLAFRQGRQCLGLAKASILFPGRGAPAVKSVTAQLCWLFQELLPLDGLDIKSEIVRERWFDGGRDGSNGAHTDGTLRILPLATTIGCILFRLWKQQEQTAEIEAQIQRVQLDTPQTHQDSLSRLSHAAEYAKPFYVSIPAVDTEAMGVPTGNSGVAKGAGKSYGGDGGVYRGGGKTGGGSSGSRKEGKGERQETMSRPSPEVRTTAKKTQPSSSSAIQPLKPPYIHPPPLTLSMFFPAAQLNSNHKSRKGSPQREANPSPVIGTRNS